MTSHRILLPLAALLALAVVSCGGGGDGSDQGPRPTNPAVTVRFVGADGKPFRPDHVELDRFHADHKDDETWVLGTWDTGEYMDHGEVQLAAGESYTVYAASWTPGAFNATNIRFTAPMAGTIDLGICDVSTQGISMSSPASGAVLTSYPVNVAWTPMTRSGVTYQLQVDSRLDLKGYLASPSQATSYSLTAANTAAIGTREVTWRLGVNYKTAEGYTIDQYTIPVPFTLPPQ